LADRVNEIDRCEVCGNEQLESVLNLGAHPMCDDLVPVEDARVCQEYPIEILFCERCATAHQRYQVPKQDLFPSTYHYRSRFTADVLNGMRQLVQACGERHGSLAGKRILDVGCNDGSLLDFFQQAGAQTFGIEPTGAFADAARKGHVTFNEFLTPALAEQFVQAHGQPDFIVFTNVFAHIENLGEVIESLRRLMSDKTVLIIENHYLGGVLSGKQFDTFYHEHPRTYSCTSFLHIAKSLGVNLIDVDFPARYGGNIRVVMAKHGAVVDTARLNEVLEREKSFGADIRSMQSDIRRWQKAKKEEIARHVKQHGKLHAKAFPGRAAILIKMLDLDADQIAGVYEKPGSMKIGHYLPGTRIPIWSDEKLQGLAEKPPVLLNLAWHISREIRGYLTTQGFHGEVIDILSQQDFKAA
jgi:SAM-dependent methyltransferase